jgi:hypothetical protein
MNKHRKLHKLTVSRETLRHLAPGEASQAAGATGYTCFNTCPVTCQASCLQYITCVCTGAPTNCNCG